MSSKYIKAQLSAELLEQLGQDLKDGLRVLFVGLPCEVHLAQTFLEKHEISTDSLYSVDLICHGPTTPKVAEQYITALEKKYKSSVCALNVRYKKPYSRPAYLYARFQNGAEHTEPFYETDYGIAFYHMPLSGCHQCKYKGPNRCSDFTIGDYWGAKEGDPGHNPYGASVAFVYTEKGNALLGDLEGFRLFTADAGKALAANPRYLTSTPLTPAAEAFRKHFDGKGLSYAVRKSMSPKQRLKKFLKKFR